MNWTEKSKEISVGLLENMEGRTDSNLTRQEVLDCIQKAAYMGMQHECDNWVLKRTKD